jgi:formylglycine-generating enzyme required for sulfatase activity
LPRPTLWLLRGDAFEMGGEEPESQPRFAAEVGSFYVSKTPITNREFAAFDPSHPRGGTSAGDHDPVVGVSFTDACGYCAWYSEISGKHFRLPTELEWEFACRGGSSAPVPWPPGADPDDFAWSAANADGRCHPIEERGANGHGLYDMLGNVWEWTASLYLPYPIEPAIGGGPAGGPDDPDRGGDRVIRGGSFRSAPADLTSSRRLPLAPAERRDDVGFRIVRSL